LCWPLLLLPLLLSWLRQGLTSRYYRWHPQAAQQLLQLQRQQQQLHMTRRCCCLRYSLMALDCCQRCHCCCCHCYCCCWMVPAEAMVQALEALRLS
jgi:hypothetical protein